MQRSSVERTTPNFQINHIMNMNHINDIIAMLGHVKLLVSSSSPPNTNTDRRP